MRSSPEMFAAIAALSEALEEFRKLGSQGNLAWVEDIEAYPETARAV